MIHATRHIFAGREFLSVSASGHGGADVQQESRSAIGAALEAIVQAGFETQYLVRSRLFARDAHARRMASDARLECLAGPLRSASSSYVDARRLPAGSNMSIDLLAMRASSGAVKHVREYAPQIAPPMFVTLDGMAFLSGVTDMSEQFEEQLACIRNIIHNSIEQAGGSPSGIVNIDAHVSRTIDADRAWDAIRVFSPAHARISLTQVDGYSAPQKLAELEATLVL